MPFLTPRLTRFLTRILDSLTVGLAKPGSRAPRLLNSEGHRHDQWRLMSGADTHLHTLPFHDQTTDSIDHDTNGETDPERKAYRMACPDEPRSTRSART